MKRDVSRLFVEALSDRSVGGLRVGAIAGATALVLAVTAGVAVWPALAPAGRVPAPAAGRLAVVPSPSTGPSATSAAPVAASPAPAPGGVLPAAGAPSGRAAPPVPGDGAPPLPASVPVPATPAPPAAAQPAVPALAAAPPVRFSFEDGGTDGWGGAGHVSSVGNSGAVAHDGSRSLQVGLRSTSPSDLPFVEVSVAGASAPAPGQTLTAWVFVSSGSVSVQGKLFVQDAGFGWHLASLATLARGGWTRLSLVVPTGIAVNALGAQFLCTPANTGTTLFVDAVNWG
jgi:hypothetical protein